MESTDSPRNGLYSQKMVHISKKQIVINGKNVDVSNNYGRQFQVSPLFSYSNSATVTAGTYFLVDIESDTPDGGASAGSGFRYSPFNNCRISNNSTCDIIVYPNQQTAQGVLVAKGTTVTLDNQATKGFNSLKVLNNDSSSSITANQVRCLFWKDNVTVDTTLKRIHSFIFNRGAK